MVSPTILIAEDDPIVRDLVRATLQSDNFLTLIVENGDEAVKAWSSSNVSLIIMDVNMPVMNGIEATKFIRRTSYTPIFMLTANDDEEDVIEGFEAGADDYIVKPFRPKELLARTHAILKRTARSESPSSDQLSFHGLMFDSARQRVLRNGEPVSVTALEFRLLHFLMIRAGSVVSKDTLFHTVWGYAMPAGGTNLIEVAIRRLRERIEDDPSNPRCIETVRGMGYRFGR